MISTSEAYKTNIKAASRQWNGKVEIYFNGIASPPTTFFGSDNTASLDFLEETQTEGDNPLGRVSSNELVVVLNNSNYAFTSTNTESAYYGKLVPNIKVVAYYGLYVSGTFEWIKLGTFWTGDWDVPSDSVYATVICQDKLFKLGDKDVPLIPTQENLTQKVIFETFFRAIGLASDNYSVDATLTTEVPIVYYPDSKVRDALSTLAVAFNCTVSMTREDVIKVSNNRTVGSSVTTFAEDNLLYSVNIPQKFENIYTDVEVKYKQHYVGAEESVLKIEDITVPAAGITLNNLKFTTAPIAFVSHIKISKATHVSVSTMELGSWGMTLGFDNSASANQVIDLEVFAYPLKATEDSVSVRDATAYSLIGEVKTLRMDNYLVQSASVAETYANLILPIVSDPKAYVYAETRGDPSIELTDTMTIDSSISKIGSIDIIPIRFDYKFSGGLHCTITGIKKSAREGV